MVLYPYSCLFHLSKVAKNSISSILKIYWESDHFSHLSCFRSGQATINCLEQYCNNLPTVSLLPAPLQPPSPVVCSFSSHWNTFQILSQVMSIPFLSNTFHGSQCPQCARRGRTPLTLSSRCLGGTRAFLNAQVSLTSKSSHMQIPPPVPFMSQQTGF